MKYLLKILNMIESIFNNLLVFTEKNYIYAQASYLYNILSDFENNNLYEDWKWKYFVDWKWKYLVLKLFDVPFLRTHNIKMLDE